MKLRQSSFFYGLFWATMITVVGVFIFLMSVHNDFPGSFLISGLASPFLGVSIWLGLVDEHTGNAWAWIGLAAGFLFWAFAIALGSQYLDERKERRVR